MTMIVDPERAQAEILAHIGRGESLANFQSESLRSNGERIDVSLTVSPIVDAGRNVVGITATVQDITQRKLAERILSDASKHKDEFLAMLAHELRNPLMPILSAVEIIRSLMHDEAMVGRALSILERQTGQMVHLIDDLLDISRITSGKIELKRERFDIRTAFDIAIETSRSLIDACNHTLTVSLPDRPIYIDADVTRIAQIGTNLLNNAAKYTGPGGRISLSAKIDGSMVEICVKDTGIGIPPEMLSKIFEMFTQIHDENAPTRGGLGLGLSLVQNLVELHGGSVEAHSEGRGTGSEFVAYLPLAEIQTPIVIPEDEQPRTSKKAAAQGSRRIKILFVDDNRDSVETFQLLLSMEHYDVRTAYDGATALETAFEFQPDTCVLDIGLPDIDGYELARRIRAQLPETLLIAVTGLGREEDRLRTFEAGFDYHFVKPVPTAELKKLLV
jgi:signal transduction histidine kinase/CheY-like chemotaxis protein